METPTKPVAGAKPAFTTQSLVMMAIFAAILCISAYISIPIPEMYCEMTVAAAAPAMP